MKLIFGQGNAGTRYDGTRHNIGFSMLDAFAKVHVGTWQNKSKFLAQIAEISLNGEKIILAKPTTFYNETGQSARALVDFYKLDITQDVLVIHDDLAIPLGTIRVRERGSDAGNNGIKSLNAHLGENYSRLRIGTWSELRDQINDIDFVLTKFNADESKRLKEAIIPDTIKLIESFCNGTLEITSHKL